MKLSKKQRAAVVELLRCAHDLFMRGTPKPLTTATRWLGASRTVNSFAWRAEWNLPPHGSRSVSILEAAARVEEGRWP